MYCLITNILGYILGFGLTLFASTFSFFWRYFWINGNKFCIEIMWFNGFVSNCEWKLIFKLHFILKLLFFLIVTLLGPNVVVSIYEIKNI